MPEHAKTGRHPVTGRFLAFDCEVDCLDHCAGLCGNMALVEDDEQSDGSQEGGS